MDWWQPGGTALVVPVAEADALVGHIRREHSPSGRDGMTAHVTVLSPAAPALDHDVIRDVCARIAPFDVTFERFSRLPAAIALVPEASDPFMHLSGVLRERIDAPDPLPPHLTLASRVGGDVLARVEAEVAPLLPISATATAVDLYVRAEDLRLYVRGTFELRG